MDVATVKVEVWVVVTVSVWVKVCVAENSKPVSPMNGIPIFVVAFSA